MMKSMFNTTVGSVLWFAGWVVLVIGIIGAVLIGQTPDAAGMNSFTGILVGASGIVSGLFLMAMSQILKFIYNIYLNTRPQEHVVSTASVSKEA